MLMAAMMQTISAQSTAESNSACSETCCKADSAACPVKENGYVSFDAMKKILAQPSSEAVQTLLKSWNYEVVRGGGNSGVFKFGKVSYNGNWAFFPNEKWAGIDYTFVPGKGVISIKWMFSSKECYEKALKDFGASEWVKETEQNMGNAFQTDFRRGTEAFVSLYAYDYGIYSIVYQVYAKL